MHPRRAGEYDIVVPQSLFRIDDPSNAISIDGRIGQQHDRVIHTIVDHRGS